MSDLSTCKHYIDCALIQYFSSNNIILLILIQGPLTEGSFELKVGNHCIRYLHGRSNLP